MAVFVLITGLLTAAPKPRRLPPEPTPILPAEIAWTVLLDTPPSAAGAMDAERVYVPLQGGGLRAFARESGEPRWVGDVSTEWPPVVAPDRVFVAVPVGILALDASDGSRLWIRPLPAAVGAPFVAREGTLVVTTEAGEVLSLRDRDGEVLWRRALGAPTTHRAALLAPARIVLTLADSRVVVLDAGTGDIVWERTVPGVLSAPATARDRVFVGSTNNFFYALDAGKGREVWRWRTGGDVVGAAAFEDRVYFASLDNILRAVDRGNGNQQWKAEIPTRPSGPPTAVGDVVVLVGIAPRLDAFVGKTGAVLGTHAATADLQGVPAIDGDLHPFRVAIVAFMRDGRVTALRPTRMLLPDPPLTPLLKLPGVELAPERPPSRLTVATPRAPEPIRR